MGTASEHDDAAVTVAAVGGGNADLNHLVLAVLSDVSLFSWLKKTGSCGREHDAVW